MRKNIFIVLGFLAQLFNIQSTSIAQSKQAPLKDANRKSLLWKISGKDLLKPSYVFGTMHSICNEDYFFTEQMQAAFDASKKLILEIDLSDPAMIAQYQQNLFLPEGKELKNFFSSEKEYQAFVDSVKKQTDIDANQFSKFKPFILISMISMKSFTCENQSSYEMNLIEMSKKRNVDIDGLESSHSQLEIFDKMNDEDIKNMLVESVSQLGNEHKEIDQMVSIYKTQDIDALYQLISQSPEFKGHEKELISGRNIKWMNTLLYEMKQQASFVAVGAGHLAGEQGVLNLLEKQGYQVEAVK
jgi:uncharacterized protein YbaP (TraB family)